MKVRRIANVSCLLLSLTVFSVSPARPAQSAQSGDQQSLAAIRAAAPRMHRSCARECNPVGAESWPASGNTRTRCRIDAKKPRG